MCKKFTFLIGFLLCMSYSMNSQDIHFTQYNFSPLTVNPAQTGDFYGSVRIGGLYRNQFTTITPNLYSTPSFYADSPVYKGFRDKDWVGAGISFYQDEAGTLGLVNGAYMMSLAYHLATNRKATNYLSIGYQTGQVYRRLKNPGEADLASQYANGQFGDPNNAEIFGLLLPDRESTTYTTHNAGLQFTSQINKYNKLKLGLAANHIGRQRFSLFTNGATGGGGGPNPTPVITQGNVKMRFTLHGSVQSQVSKQLAFLTSWYGQKMSSGYELAVQCLAGYLLNEEKDFTLNFGLGYRVGDAAQLLVGATSGRFKFGVAYDVNLSGLTPATNTVGGFEMAAQYIINIYKKPTVDPVIICPRF